VRTGAAEAAYAAPEPFFRAAGAAIIESWVGFDGKTGKWAGLISRSMNHAAPETRVCARVRCTIT